MKRGDAGRRKATGARDRDARDRVARQTMQDRPIEAAAAGRSRGRCAMDSGRRTAGRSAPRADRRRIRRACPVGVLALSREGSEREGRQTRRRRGGTRSAAARNRASRFLRREFRARARPRRPAPGRDPPAVRRAPSRRSRSPPAAARETSPPVRHAQVCRNRRRIRAHEARGLACTRSLQRSATPRVSPPRETAGRQERPDRVRGPPPKRRG